MNRAQRAAQAVQQHSFDIVDELAVVQRVRGGTYELGRQSFADRLPYYGRLTAFASPERSVMFRMFCRPPIAA